MNTQTLARFKNLYCRVTDAYGHMTTAGPEAIREPFTDDLIRAHIEGREFLGAYLICTGGLTDRLVFDIDTGDSDLARRIVSALDDIGIEAYITSSKSRGYHVTAHTNPTDAAIIRRIGRFIAHRVAAPFIEYFPKQDRRAPGGLGSFVWLDLHGEYLKAGKTAFLDYDNGLTPLPDQWAALDAIVVNPDEALMNAVAVVELWEGENVSGKIKLAAPVAEQIPELHRNESITSLAGSLWRTMCQRGLADPKVLKSALREVNRNRCCPPLEDSEVDDIAESVSKYSHDSVQVIPDNIAPIYTAGDLVKPTEAAWNAIKTKNFPEYLFQYGGPVRVGEDGDGRSQFEPLTVDKLKYEVARAAPWKSRTRDKETKKWTERDAKPATDIIRDMLATPSDLIPLPRVLRMVEVPTFAVNGMLCDRPGYNPENLTYYAPVPGVVIPRIPAEPTEEQQRAARAKVFEPFIDFPFKSDADKAHTIALALLPYVRDMVNSLTPIHLFNAPVHGTGKTLAATKALYPAFGKVPFVSQSRDEEYQKVITSLAMAGRQVFFLDNVTKPINSATISKAVTSQILGERVLGKNTMFSAPNRFIFIVTGNNVTLTGELSRRCVLIHIDANEEEPWLRKEFIHPDLDAWVTKNRGELIAAAITLIRGWVVAGMPMWREKTLGSFEGWARVMGGILQHAGIPGFLDNLDELYDSVDTESEALGAFVTEWWEKHLDTEVTVKDLFSIMENLDGVDLGKGDEKAQRTALGMLLGSKKDLVFNGLKIVKGKRKGKLRHWKLVNVRKGPKT